MSGTGDIRLDAVGLAVLAHPLRSRLLTLLRLRGPATATGLARTLSTNTGATSYHLRRLADVGLVEDTGTGRGRERVWRAGSHSHSWQPSDFADQSDALAALAWLDRFYLATFVERYQAWLTASEHWPAPWHDGFGVADTVLWLTAEEVIRLRGELDAVVRRYRTTPTPPTDPADPTGPGAAHGGRREVALYTFAFPSNPEP